jgi:hypothetical protein
MALGRRACALVAVLALLVGTLAPGAGSSAGCGACPPGCPMHARRIGCHAARQQPSCHHGAPAAGLRTACGHREQAASSGVAAYRGIVPARIDVRPRLVVRASVGATVRLARRPPPAPTPGPPRSSLV